MQMMADNDAHAARRKVLNEALPSREQTFRSLNPLAQKFAKSAGMECNHSKKVDKEMTKPIDISVLATWYSFDVISCVAFGKSLDMLQNAKYRWIPDCLLSTSIFLYWAGYAPFVQFWRWFLSSSLPSWLRMQTAIDTQTYGEFANEMVATRGKRLLEETHVSMEGSDIFQQIIKAELYDERDTQADSSLLIAAGSDAVRLTIAATIFYWLQNPLVFERAEKEIRSIEQITDSTTLSSLPYLRACVDETMRLCPPKASSLPREVLRGGIIIDDIHVSEGMTVGTSIYALHHEPDIYVDPFAYNPDRWLVRPRDPRMLAAFCPFLKGPRSCPGQTIAYLAIELALYQLVYRYDVRAAGGKVTDGGHENVSGRKAEYQFKDWILGFAAGPLIELKEREL